MVMQQNSGFGSVPRSLAIEPWVSGMVIPVELLWRGRVARTGGVRVRRAFEEGGSSPVNGPDVGVLGLDRAPRFFI